MGVYINCNLLASHDLGEQIQSIHIRKKINPYFRSAFKNRRLPYSPTFMPTGK
jgi:hypothetical protein